MILAQLIVQEQGIKPKLLKLFFIVKLFEALTRHEEGKNMNVFDLRTPLDHIYEVVHILINL